MEASRLDTKLPHKMAQLDIGESSEQNVLPECSRPLLRREPWAPEPSKSTNFRISMKPRKPNLLEDANIKQIEALHLNKTIKASMHTLETIYEIPRSSISGSGSDALIGKQKFKRLLTFEMGSQEKIKKRRAKIKKLLGNNILRRKKILMDVFLKALE